MNERILQQDIQEHINNHLKSDIHKLILKGVPFEGVTVQEVANQVNCKQKSEKNYQVGSIPRIFIIHQK